MLECSVIKNTSSSSPLGRAVACPLEDGCHTLLGFSLIISPSIYIRYTAYDTVKSTCCIKSPHLLEGGGMGSEVGA